MITSGEFPGLSFAHWARAIGTALAMRAASTGSAFVAETLNNSMLPTWAALMLMALAFWFGLSHIITRHAVRIHAVVKRVTDELGVTFVDLFRDPDEDPFVKEPHRYYCADGLHPSGEGYGLWFAALMM